MSQVINNFPGTAGRPPIYPWDEWCDGRIRRLFQGEDFFSDPKSFRVLAHRTAKGRGLKARFARCTESPKNSGAYVLVFYDPNES